jgi:hypothetical protein
MGLLAEVHLTGRSKPSVSPLFFLLDKGPRFVSAAPESEPLLPTIRFRGQTETNKMKRLATFAAALAVALASPNFASPLAAATTTLAPDESPAALLAASAAVAEARDDAASLALKRPLRPGGFWWASEIPQSGEMEVIVSLEDQRAFVYRAGRLIGMSTISSGKDGKETPAGIFPILEKKRTHFSRKYDNAPMPFMQRLDQWGIALHGGAIPGYRASRGCVRLPHAFAAKLFAMTEVGDRVVIG